ncbi:TATE DNA Transposon [Leptomonas pyrrhocoris]|uniref:TATE DNA Transposon n=1 Tax=Leptomonas pyrrhocoris TaxID=157538 RepID=A0A0M9FY89_LEPPY|nr:TATE DNA Transposon [Leptomonas pyrrhocoris]KPA78423.1 TATE DNA Transposon [Leptomonas pyrrhocoris]|eukprot:XP_015656862.1 TATE DNA Transposon [Leptomonas pyrrhocoris]
MVYLAPERVKTLVEKVRRQGVLYFPIFVMKHWIAGVLTTYDSAPSPVVEEKLRSVFARVWPGLRMVKGQCPRQERYSDDCGLYMTANFFLHHLQARLVDRRDLPRCLRRLLYAAKKHNPPVEYFHEKMRKVLTSHPVSRCDRFYDEIERAPWKRETRSWAQRVAGPAVHTGGAAPRKAPARRQAARRTASAAAPAARRARAETARTQTARARQPTAATTARARQSATTPRAAVQRGARRSDVTNPPPTPQRPPARRPTRAEREAEDEAVLRRLEAAPVQQPETVPARVQRTRRERSVGDAPGRPVAGWADETLAKANRSARKVYEGVIDHLWAATALAMCGDGVPRGLGDSALNMQRMRHGLRELQPYSVQEMLKLLHKRVHVLDRAGATPGQNSNSSSRSGSSSSSSEAGDSEGDAGEGGFVFRPEDGGAATRDLGPGVDECYLVRGARLGRLPSQVGRYEFVLGARLTQAPRDMDGVRYPSYYELTRSAEEATVGAYIRHGMTHYRLANAHRVSRNAERYVPVPRSAQQREEENDVPDEEGDVRNLEAQPLSPLRRREHWPGDGAEGATREGPAREADGYADMDGNISAEATRALEDLRAAPLNMQGRPLTGTEEAEACPRNWFLFSTKPPHVSQLAWNAVRPDTREHHLRWLARIKAMSSERLRMSLPCACIDLIMATARARRWKWATTSKAFAGVAGALRDLPLYSTQRRGIRLQDDPEWRSAFGSVQRYMRESVPDAPPFLTLQQVRSVLDRLRLPHPRAALFLAMMWGFAARACDIATLRAKDVTVFPSNGPPPQPEGAPPLSMRQRKAADPGLRVTITVRRGKGAKKRGPYPVPSVLTREMGAVLQELLVQRRPSEELFAPHTEQLRRLVASELGRVLKGAQLPSVRKGALRCMAEAGVPSRDLMVISGHAKPTTLLRYLGYGQQPTAEAEAARAGASRALFPTP